MDVKHFLRAFSFRLFFAVCALNVIGILAINSATNQSMAYVGRQATGMALGIAIIALICFVPYQKLLRYAVLVFAICAILLLMVRFSEEASTARSAGSYCRESDRCNLRSSQNRRCDVLRLVARKEPRECQ